MPDKRAGRTRKLKRKISRSGLDALLVTDPSDIRYLSSFYMPPAMLLVSKKGTPVYFVSSMNKALAEKVMQGAPFKIVSAGRSLFASIASVLKERKIKRIGYNECHLTVSQYRAISGIRPKLLLRSARDIIKELRAVKGAGEISTLRKAAKETVRIWRKASRNIRTGMTEREIAFMIDMMVHSAGYKSSFPTIAAIGENSAFPHAVPMGRRLKKGDHLLVDFGIRHNGYCSDLTRIWAGGRIVRKIAELEKHVRKAHDLAIKKVRHGLSIKKLINEADIYFKSNKIDGYVRHGLGHGVGLDIHEEPLLGPGSKGTLKEGMVITIEPGLYMPGVGGIRLEDMVLVTKKGYKVLTK